MRQETTNHHKGIVLIGHGAVAKDCPRELVAQLKALEAQRRETDDPPTPQEHTLEDRIRHWPRTPATDPYQAGLKTLAATLQPLLSETVLAVAYLEFCAPTLEEAVHALFTTGITDVVVVPSMLTPGGVHSEVDIPTILDQLRTQYPSMILRYAWPFDMHLLSRLLAEHLTSFLASEPQASTGRQT